MTKDEALQMCLEYIETNAHERRHVRWAIKEALAQPEQEAVGSVVTYYDSLTHGWFGDPPPEGTLLYIVPPQPEERPWVGLTVDELIDLEHKHLSHENLTRAIEDKLREKNT